MTAQRHTKGYELSGDTCNRSPFAFKCDWIFSWHSNNVVASTESDNVIMYDVAEAVPPSYWEQAGSRKLEAENTKPRHMLVGEGEGAGMRMVSGVSGSVSIDTEDRSKTHYYYVKAQLHPRARWHLPGPNIYFAGSPLLHCAHCEYQYDGSPLEIQTKVHPKVRNHGEGPY